MPMFARSRSTVALGSQSSGSGRRDGASRSKGRLTWYYKTTPNGRRGGQRSDVEGMRVEDEGEGMAGV
jgi:hypothetical protein